MEGATRFSLIFGYAEAPGRTSGWASREKLLCRLHPYHRKLKDKAISLRFNGAL